MSAPAQQQRHAWVDYAKGIAIILVVYRHLMFGLQSSHFTVPEWLINGNDMLYSFRMPLFFCLSGLFFRAGIEKRGASLFLQNKINTLLYPYLLWSVIQITLQLCFSGYVNAQRSWYSYVEIFVQPRSLDQLWYLFALFNVTALYLFNSTVLRLPEGIQLLLGALFLGLAPYTAGFSTVYDMLLHYFFFAIGVSLAGTFFSDRTQTQLTSGKKLLLLLPLFLLSQWYFLWHQQLHGFLYAVVALTGSLFVVMLSMLLAKYRKMRFLTTIGHYSLYIYLLHVMIAAVLRYVLLKSGLFTDAPLLLLLLVASSIPLSIIVYRICEKAGMGFLFRGSIGHHKTVTG